MGLEEVKQNDTRELVRAEMEREGLSQPQVAREAGISASKLSQWLSGKYQGDNRAADDQLRRWLRVRAERLSGAAMLPEAPAWVQTPTAKSVMAALSYAHMAGDISVVYGGAGLGKSCTALEYQRQRPSVFLVTMTPATSTSPATCLERIALGVGIREAPAGAARIEAAIVARIQGTCGLLIVDEAQHLKNPATLESVRSLHDATGIGLALLGNESVYSQLTGGARQAHFAQLFSRIGRRVRLNRPAKDDVAILLDAWGLDGQARDVAQRIAGQPGALRGLTKTLRLASMMAAGAGEAGISLETIKAAWADLGGMEV